MTALKTRIDSMPNMGKARCIFPGQKAHPGLRVSSEPAGVEIG